MTDYQKNQLILNMRSLLKQFGLRAIVDALSVALLELTCFMGAGETLHDIEKEDLEVAADNLQKDLY